MPLSYQLKSYIKLNNKNIMGDTNKKECVLTFSVFEV
jgi:hypothetical protein